MDTPNIDSILRAKVPSLGIGREWYHVAKRIPLLFVSPRGHFIRKADVTHVKAIFPLEVAYRTGHEVTAEEVVLMTGTEEFRSIGPLRRQCYYPEEKTLKAFPTYSKTNCELECTWREALDDCGCLPWYLRELFPSASMCDNFGNSCFRKYMNAFNDGSQTFDCGGMCLNDCEGYSFNANAKHVFYRDHVHIGIIYARVGIHSITFILMNM